MAALQAVKKFLRDDTGANAIEYGLLATLIAIAFAVGANLLGAGLNTLFTNIAACFGAAGGACPVAALPLGG